MSDVILCDGTVFNVVFEEDKWMAFPADGVNLDTVEGDTEEEVMSELEELDDLAFYYRDKRGADDVR
jgi:hypothetical protein